MKRIILFVLMLFLSLGISSEIKYKISGKVIRNGVGYDGAILTLDKWNIRKVEISSFKSLTFKSVNAGEFHFYARPGQYILNCKYVFPGVNEIFGLDSDTPIIVEVKNKNINNLNIVLFKIPEIVEANRDILNSNQTGLPTVSYKWGMIPLQTLGKCRKAAVFKLNEELTINNKNILAGYKLSDPIIFYDMQDNAIFYQFPIFNLGVEIGSIDVSAIGRLKPKIHDYGFLDLDYNEFKEKRNEYIGVKGGIHTIEKQAIINFAQHQGINQDDLEIVKYRCLEPDSTGLCIEIKNKTNNQLYIINPYFNYLEGGSDSFNEIRETSETVITYFYMQELAAKNGQTLKKK